MGADQSVTVAIGSDGGSIVLEGQQGMVTGVSFQLDIPPGALSQTTQLSITETSVSPPDDFIDFSPVYLIEPRGLTLGKVAALRVPWSSNVGAAPGLAIYERLESGSCEFEPLVDSYSNAGFEQASLTQFGYLFVGAPPASAGSACGVDAATESDGPAGQGGEGGTSDAAVCGETIDDYCQADSGAGIGARALIGPCIENWVVAKQEASVLCDDNYNVWIQECDGYGILTLGGVDTASHFYYDLATSTLVRIEYSANGSNRCVASGPGGSSGDAAAGAGIMDGAVSNCPADPYTQATSLCVASDGAVD